MGELLSSSLRGFLMTSNKRPFFFLGEGVYAFSYSAMRLRGAGDEGLSRGAPSTGATPSAGAKTGCASRPYVSAPSPDPDSCWGPGPGQETSRIPCLEEEKAAAAGSGGGAVSETSAGSGSINDGGNVGARSRILSKWVMLSGNVLSISAAEEYGVGVMLLQRWRTRKGDECLGQEHA